MKNNLYEKFVSLGRRESIQFRLEVDSKIGVFYGITQKGCYRLSFLSTHDSKISGDTENIEVYAGAESDGVFWTCFDLTNSSLLQSFCVLGEDLISSIEHEDNELFALQKIKNRYNSWKKLLKKPTKSISKEEIKGLYGELYCLKEIIAPKYGYNKAVFGWGGPENLSKDFAIDDTWYEIKTTGVASATVKISSIQQLESSVTGHLIVLKVEEMADAYDGEETTSINKLCQSIIGEIDDDEVRDAFLSHLSEKTPALFDEALDQNFALHGTKIYRIDDDFPSLKLTPEQAESVHNATYELLLDKIEKFVEE